MLSLKYNQQDAMLNNLLYCCQRSTCFRRFFRPSSGAQTVHTASGMSSLFAFTASVGDLPLPTHQLLYVQFELLMMKEKSPETCIALTAVKNIV
jgi:hypothetical protein